MIPAARVSLPSALPASLYECRVTHHRFSPREHRFVYRLFYLGVDLDELPALSRRLRLFSWNKANVFSLRDRDYLPLGEPVCGATGSGSAAPLPAGTPLKERVAVFCARHGRPLGPDPRVQLITLPRVLGYQFNPVSFYYCCARDGEPRAAIAEVTNTFREVKPYFIPATTTSAFRQRLPKHFYVSPFSAPDLEFDFQLHRPAERLAVRIDDYEGGRRVLHSTLAGDRRDLSDALLARFLVKYPLLTAGVMLRIHWQALRLWRKRVPFHRKAEVDHRQRDFYRPAATPATPATPTDLATHPS